MHQGSTDTPLKSILIFFYQITAGGKIKTGKLQCPAVWSGEPGTAASQFLTEDTHFLPKIYFSKTLKLLKNRQHPS
jgi:hypothetical protein